MRSRLETARYRRRLVVLILVATGMVFVKLVATSWKGSGSYGVRTNRVGQAKSAPGFRRAH
jgi:hypothetical protein